MKDNEKNDANCHPNATTVTTAGHNFPECSTGDEPAPAEQLGGNEESQPVQRIVEIRTPIQLSAKRVKQGFFQRLAERGF